MATSPAASAARINRGDDVREPRGPILPFAPLDEDFLEHLESLDHHRHPP